MSSSPINEKPSGSDYTPEAEKASIGLDDHLPTMPEIEHDLKEGIARHNLLADPNIDPELRDRMERALETGDVAAEKEIEEELLNDSIYPEVRAAVANIDDPDMPVNTFRAWFLGLFFVIVLSGLNQLLYFRYPSVQINGLVVQLVSFPFGKALEKILPRTGVKTRWGTMTLNPGPFNVKEHTMISIMATVVWQRAYATDIFLVQRIYYNQTWSFGYQLLVTLSTQFIGFSFAGFARRFLIWPASMIWPTVLPYCTLLSTLHKQKATEPGVMGRGKFFTIAFAAAFCWYFFPGYIFTALSTFNWICWIVPNNVVVNQLFGVTQGLGMSVLTFDWSQINYFGASPLVTPMFAQLNTVAGLVIFFWICCPAMMYTNTRFSKYLPMSTTHVFDRFGERYDVTKVTTPLGTLDEAAYNTYSKQYLSPVFSMSYGLSFASMTATLVHTYLYSGKDIWRQFKRSVNDEPDIHARLMSVYKEVPIYWYVGTFFLSLAMGLAAIEAWPTQLPVWALFLAIAIGALYTVPIAVIYAVSNVEVGLNVITEFIIGYARPGKPVAMMLFKTWGYISMYQAVSFMSDQKFGHYMKVSPRSVFAAQMVASFISVFVLLGVQNWALSNIEGICTPDASDNFICPGATVFGTASIIWGLLGPARNFSGGQVYNAFLYFFLVGAIVPIPTYFLAKRYPKSWIRYVNWPVIFSGTGYIPPATGINYSSWAFVGFLSHVVWRGKNFAQWSRYNYVLSAALDAGTGISTILIFFVLIFPQAPALQNWAAGAWWGNTVSSNTADANFATLLTPPEAGFAPPPGGWGAVPAV
ncbi:small oligopeptide transporter [Jaminaea rosea]|uniref:Small oligopeptide transporter n=1 Tax=Jaminaea rosea TaxID=1569628 RepID=A0A316UVT5_9BASI|nr:small oligopeptide transporter [Jaminaea rosea]PWN29400.1 small oligopeptide transporter [Jaminaea rosea]